MPLSPPFRPSPNSSTSPPPIGPLPTLPFEIIRRIIFHRLSIPPSYPSPLENDYVPSWDSRSGVKGKISAQKRLDERRDVTRSARGLMTVCKAWKPLVMKYLYSSPYITTNLSSLASCVLNGDSKWSDINIHIFSIPGRYITLLDLSTISFSVHPTEIRKACLSIFPSLPNVNHLKLPSGELPFGLEEIGWSPFAKNLKCLEGVEVDLDIRDDGKDGLVELLRKLPNLEVLEVLGSTIHDHPSSSEDLGPPLNLTKLHTIKLEDVKNGNLLTALSQANLPVLERLSITSFFGQPDDLTFTFQEIHGTKIRSLTYLQGKLSPFALGSEMIVPTEHILELYPILQHLAFLIPDYEQLDTIVQLLKDSPHHSLNTLTIHKFVQIRLNDGQPLNSRSKDTNTFLKGLIADSPKGMKRINVDGFKWVKPELGKMALDTGTSGEMRKLSNLLFSKHGIELGDMDGNLIPSPQSTVTACGKERVYGPMSGGGRRRSSGGQSMIRMNISMNGTCIGVNNGIERGNEEEDGG
ncbi:uncharacterized protein I206_105597 [Kwoniella pini CBS 10737]|uniref:Uncharacterized protein n=1 Tax=Kwoniella pini CBS 10737 TaxID=1296096 RepID=A0A1B9I3U0_9TREE|nr:uncharacterized protein I206_03502 [Kwoniella pini CBS 10737]OCF50183.1 hypothetical protein I206_03502 [Kwoniella pini CBS 10737]